jgi:hypothetical protein
VIFFYNSLVGIRLQHSRANTDFKNLAQHATHASKKIFTFLYENATQSSKKCSGKDKSTLNPTQKSSLFAYGQYQLEYTRTNHMFPRPVSVRTPAGGRATPSALTWPMMLADSGRWAALRACACACATARPRAWLPSG